MATLALFLVINRFKPLGRDWKYVYVVSAAELFFEIVYLLLKIIINYLIK